MIRIDMLRQDTCHPDRRRRHARRASCEVADRRFEAQGPAPIYRIATLMWLDGLGGAEFEVWDSLSPFGRPGGLAMTGRVRNWARLVNGKPMFDKDAPSEVDLTPHERDLIARAAGNVAEIDSARPDNRRTAATRLLGGPDYPQEEDNAATGVVGASPAEAA